jgi:hypothetical protein
LLLSLALATLPAQAGDVDKEKLAEVDKHFACPESLPDGARQDAVKQYILQLRGAWPDASVDDLIAYRKFLLKKHGCTKTLEALQRQDR